VTFRKADLNCSNVVPGAAMLTPFAGLAERKRMLGQYLDQYILQPPANAKAITVEVEVDEAFLNEVSEKIEGFSGREISKLAISWQAAAYGTSAATLSKVLSMILEYNVLLIQAMWLYSRA
jgi:hypothetical protein